MLRDIAAHAWSERQQTAEQVERSRSEPDTRQAACRPAKILTNVQNEVNLVWSVFLAAGME